jgi:hypothetical protein
MNQNSSDSEYPPDLEKCRIQNVISNLIIQYKGFFPLIDMTQTADGKTKITGRQAPVIVNTHGIYPAHRILTGMVGR